eukprot:1161646-Pelagomonas_calceolata.AAC.4
MVASCGSGQECCVHACWQELSARATIVAQDKNAACMLARAISKGNHCGSGQECCVHACWQELPARATIDGTKAHSHPTLPLLRLLACRTQIATVCSMVSVGASILYRPKDKQVCQGVLAHYTVRLVSATKFV